ncbi:MAG: sulfurtransferase [Gammaproteobacteria bacterium]|nr:sulfurtransferase [Gammaproteobacteria bacterium]
MRLNALTATLVATSMNASAIDESAVREKWHTPFGLYLSAREAYELKTSRPDEVLFIDVRTPLELRYVGVAEQIDANIPYRFDTTEWRAKSGDRHGTFRRELNFQFEAAVENALQAKGLDKSSPIIIMCTSGSRAPYAARALYDAGFKTVYTQVEGFEGVKARSGPQTGKRVVAGWKHEGLPWSYELQAEKMYFNFAPTPAPSTAPRAE